MCDVKTGTSDRWSLRQTRSPITLCIYKLISVDMSVPHRLCGLPRERLSPSVMAIVCFFALFLLQMKGLSVFALPTLRIRWRLVFGLYGDVTCVASVLKFTF